MAQLMPLSLTVSCFSKIQTGFTFLVPADQGSPGKMAVKRVCAYNDLHKSRLLEISVGAISPALSPPSRPSPFLSLPFPLPFLTLSLFCLCNFLSPRSLPVNPTRGSGELVTSFFGGILFVYDCFAYFCLQTPVEEEKRGVVRAIFRRGGWRWPHRPHRVGAYGYIRLKTDRNPIPTNSILTLTDRGGGIWQTGNDDNR